MGRCSDARDRLLATAARLVHERGYTAVSVADICSEAGLKKGSFYHFFRSKHALVLATLDRFAERHQANVERARKADQPARERLVTMMAAMKEGFVQAQGFGCGCPVGNLAQEMAHRDDALRARLAEIFASWQVDLARLLRWADETEQLRVPDPERSAEALMAFMQGSILLAKTHHDPGIFERLAPGMIALAQADLPRPGSAGGQIPANVS